MTNRSYKHRPVSEFPGLEGLVAARSPGWEQIVVSRLEMDLLLPYQSPKDSTASRLGTPLRGLPAGKMDNLV